MARPRLIALVAMLGFMLLPALALAASPAFDVMLPKSIAEGPQTAVCC